MGSDIQRALLWILFGLSAFMLYDRWQVYNGHPSLIGADTEQTAPANTASNASVTPPTATGSGVVPQEAAPAVKKADLITVETDLVKLSIDPNGAVIAGSQLLKEKQQVPWTDVGLVGMILGNKPEPAKDVELFTDKGKKIYVAQTGLIGGAFPTHKTEFKLVPGPLKLEDGKNTLEVKFEGEAGGVKVVKTYTFERNHYGIKVSHQVFNNTGHEIKPSVYYQLTRDGDKPEGESTMVNAYTGTAVYTEKEKFQKVSFGDIADGDRDYQVNADNGWIGIIQHYFVSAWVPTQGVNRENYTRKLADYGWLTFLAKPIYWLLSFLHSIVGNWGWAIVLLTCIVKAILYPLSLAGYRSMAKMKDLAPRMKALKEKYGDDKQRLNMAMMEMYKTEKINPVGGCLPILLQLPVFLALYWVLLASVELRDAPWILWVTDLAAPDPWFILPVLMIISMVIQFKLNPTPPDPMQAKMMAFMPFIFGAMFIFFASGLVLYWLVNNILSIVQQYAVNKQIERDRLKRQSN